MEWNRQTNKSAFLIFSGNSLNSNTIEKRRSIDDRKRRRRRKNVWSLAELWLTFSWHFHRNTFDWFFCSTFFLIFSFEACACACVCTKPKFHSHRQTNIVREQWALSSLSMDYKMQRRPNKLQTVEMCCGAAAMNHRFAALVCCSRFCCRWMPNFFKSIFISFFAPVAMAKCVCDLVEARYCQL